VVEYQAIVEAVQDEAELSSNDQARHAAVAVLSGLGHCLPLHARRQLAEELPDVLDDGAAGSGAVEPRAGSELVDEVATRMDTTAEDARLLTRSVVAGLETVDAGLVDYLLMRLRPDVLDVVKQAAATADSR
jgi:hypothetical protein